ncbi:MAG TPA: 3-oxoacyl-[acyl-carrier-protein] reductase [Anaerolineales bacterium]|nr:3-oxoacyl-[acyl-carrier-protein] reductase [Anaerolineales bacterium]
MRFSGKVALVTGASRGIGRAIAERLAGEGAKVAINYARDADGAQAAVSAITANGGNAIALQADVSNFVAAETLVAETIKALGGLDILVNNAGTTRDQLIMRMSEEDWDEVIRTNLKSAFNCCKAVTRPMMRSRKGRIINISSVSGVAGNAGQTNYAASKAGMIGFTKSLARELASRNITVNAIAPGFVPTKLTIDLPEELRTATLAQIPLNRWGTPDEIAAAVAFFASDEAGYITGQTLNVDGGMVMS